MDFAGSRKAFHLSGMTRIAAYAQRLCRAAASCLLAPMATFQRCRVESCSPPPQTMTVEGARLSPRSFDALFYLRGCYRQGHSRGCRACNAGMVLCHVGLCDGRISIEMRQSQRLCIQKTSALPLATVQARLVCSLDFGCFIVGIGGTVGFAGRDMFRAWLWGGRRFHCIDS
jgi:hypothetical protein